LSDRAPDIPTIAEAGVTGFEGVGDFVAPAHTPKPIVDRLYAKLMAITAGLADCLYQARRETNSC